MPIVVSATPWFTLLGLIALLLAIVSRRILAALIAIAAIACNGYWQYPFFYSTDPLPQAAQNAVAAASPNTSDAYARVMTFNVYKGQADPQAIVELVRDQRVEVLALQETTEDFVRFVDAARESGHGFTFSWPTNRVYMPMFAGIDHVVLDQGMKAGQCKVVKVEGSDHAALLATVAVG